MQIDTGFADVNGTRLYYEITGFGHPLVLIHGNTLDTRMWDDQFEVFAQHYQVLRYDARGFGKSAAPTTEPYTHPDDLKSLMSHLGINRAHIIGLSMGGAIAINFALTYPASTATLTAVDAGLPGYQWQEELASVTAKAIAKRDGIESAKTFWLNSNLFAPAAENPSVASRLKQIVDDYPGWHFVNADPASARERSKGARVERGIVALHQAAGIACEKVSRSGYSGEDLRIAGWLKGEVKGRKEAPKTLVN